jgi:hypothetical protein
MVLNWIQFGVSWDWEGLPEEDTRTFPQTKEQLDWLRVELAHLVDVGAIKHVGYGLERPAGLHLRVWVFLVPKKGSKKWHLVINLRGLNLACQIIPAGSGHAGLPGWVELVDVHL